MRRVKFNQSVYLVLLSSSLTIVGCTESPKQALNLTDNAPIYPTQDDNSGRHQYNNLHLHNATKTASNHKNTVWERMLSLYSLPEINNPRVDRELYWYLDHPAALAIIQQRAEPYLSHILDEIEAKNMPGELALLPVVESAFVPDAYSKADASGLWQFVPATGKEYGLQQNDWYDGRRDIYASTKAATTYLKELNETFDGDWLLALASYNCGKGRLKKSIDKNTELNLPTDYWSLDLPPETEDYVPRLLAIAKIFGNADEYNINLQHIPNRPYFEVVDIKSPIDLSKAAELANTPLHVFLKLNPGFNKASTAPQGPHRLLVPVAHAEHFKNKLAELPISERVTAKYIPDVNTKPTILHADNREDLLKPLTTGYKVKAGESLASIATKNHTTPKTLQILNHLKVDTIKVGMNLQIPNEAKPNLNKTLLAQLEKPNKPKTPSNQSYEIKKGDTLYEISQRFSVSPKDLAAWNNVSSKSVLAPGTKLTIKIPNQQVASAAPIHLVNYTVAKNDSLVQISKKFNIPINDLRKANASALAKGIHPGIKLKIVVDGNQFSS